MLTGYLGARQDHVAETGYFERASTDKKYAEWIVNEFGESSGIDNDLV